jgi:hypothetical protein
MSIPIPNSRLLTELHTVLSRLSNIKHISGEECHLDQMEKFEIRAVIKYLCKKGMPPCRLGKESHSYSTVKKWAAEYKRGKESIGDDEWSGWPKEANNDETAEAVHDLVMCDRRRDLTGIAREVDSSFGSV